MSSNAIPPGGITPGSSGHPLSGRGMAGAGKENGGDEPNAERAADPFGIEPSAETRDLIAELQHTSDDVIVDRILADRRVITAVVRLEQAKIDSVALELYRRLPTIAEQSQELAEDPLIHSLLAMISVDIRKQLLEQLGLPTDMKIPPAPGNRVEPPSPPAECI